MSNSYRLSPETPGGLGSNSVLLHGKGHPRVQRLHFVFEGWFGDDLVSSYPIYIITQRLAESLSALGATGFTLREVEISKSDQFELFHPERILPKFLWLDVTGMAGEDDLGLDQNARLVVSERVYNCLKAGNLRHCRIEYYGLPRVRQLELGFDMQ